jgi:hypothetical protein
MDNLTGRFTFEDVPFGDYILYIERPGYVIRTLSVTISPSDDEIVVLTAPDKPVFEIKGGDVDTSWIVFTPDFNRIGDRLGTTYGDALYDPYSDFDADGDIDNDDLQVVTDNMDFDILDYPGAEELEFWR